MEKKEDPTPLTETEKLQLKKSSAWKQLKVNEGWRFMLGHTEANELQEDIEIFKQVFERHVEGLDDVINSLERDLNEVERQSAHVQRVHLHLLEHLSAMQDKHVLHLQHQWDNNLKHLCTTFHYERKHMHEHTQQREAKLEEAKVNVEQEHQRLTKEIDKLYNDSLASYRTAHEAWDDALVHEGQVALKEQAHKNYKLLKNLRKEQKELNELIMKKQQHIQITNEKLAMIKNVEKHREKLRSIQRRNELMERNLKNSIFEVRQKTFKLRDQLTQEHQAAKKQLLELIMNSDAATKKLQMVINKGQRVLRVGKMCWKLERKIGPMGLSLPLNEGEEGAAKETVDFTEIPRVMHSLNIALLHRESLKRERKILTRENAQLRYLLRKQQDGTIFSERSLSAQHTLLTIPQSSTSASNSMNI
ncbi:dynein regulatory complex subunit 2-like [Cynoglossus semilaevis]|uniref:dynein regulatory complex subunit 2-like n=1 Tax=Cynoglossus semilaevis TaxID=244447 RepID=UPI000494EA20|nr:dynein regulatory complex subunit 2-like [Cynoglossus semilaevis]